MPHFLHQIFWHFACFMGLTDINGAWYAWWSGIGSDLAEFGLLYGVFRGFKKARRQRDEQAGQLHNHINQLITHEKATSE